MILQRVVLTEKYEFRFQDGRTVIWDVILAKKLILERPDRPLVEMPRNQMEIIAEWDLTEVKLKNADPTKPGICAILNLSDGPGLIMIDGCHRAVKALQTGKKFFLQRLTLEESKKCIIQCSDWSLIP